MEFIVLRTSLAYGCMVSFFSMEVVWVYVARC